MTDLLKIAENLAAAGLGRFVRLYHAVNAMMNVVGSDGDIDSRHAATAAVMDALKEIDGGQYDAGLQSFPAVDDAVIKLTNADTHPARGVVDDDAVNRALDAWFAGDCERPHYDEHIDAMRAALQAAQPAVPSVPEGMVLVPKEPTPEMIAAGENSIRADVDPGRKPQRRTAHRAARNAYVSMLAATPKDRPAQGVDGAPNKRRNPMEWDHE